MVASGDQTSVISLRSGWMQRARSLSLPFSLFVSLLVVVTLGVRLYGIDWDQGSLFHPDERAIYMKVWELAFPIDDLTSLLNADESPWNPRWFPYGSYPLYQLKATQILLSPFMDFEFGDLRFAGRTLSALADTGTVLVVLLLGTRIFGRRTGILAAILVAFSVIHIQLSHFYTVETFFTLFITLSLFFLFKVLEQGRLRDSALTGVFVGLALATKVSATPVLAAVAAAYLMYAFSEDGWRLSLQRPTGEKLARALGGSALTLGVAGLTFFVVAPFAILDWPTFLGDVLYQGSMVTREADLPYTRQYENTLQYWYHFRQLSLWGLGLPLGFVAWGGLILAVATLWRGRHRGVVLLLAWVIPYFLITGSLQVKFLRYLLPITPFLVLMGAHLLVVGVDLVATRRPRWLSLAQGGVILVLVASAFYAFAYLRIYNQPHTATRASQWIQENVPPGSLFLTEHWEEGFPNLYAYRLHVLPMYEADTPQKVGELATALEEGDYLLFFSNRLYGTIPRLPERYPLSTRYYQALFSGELGYQLVHWENSYPNLLGVALVDDTFTRPNLPAPVPLDSYSPAPLSLNLGYADESFTVYDHPKVIIFQNVQRLGQESLLTVLTTLDSSGAAGTIGLMLTASEVQTQQEGGTWQDIVHPEGWGSRWVPWSWLLLVLVITVAILPIALLLFHSLPDKGFLLAKPLGILMVSYIVWLLASLKVTTFSTLTIYLVIAFVASISVAVGYHQRTRLISWVRDGWRLWLLGEGIFLVAFLGFFALRLANPDLWHPWRGGEKFMELAYLMATTKSIFMPPYDPWFAEGYLNYYYFGYFIIATFIKALGMAPSVAFNLAVPLIAALTVSGAFSLVYNLVARANPDGIGVWRGISFLALGGGVTGGVFVAVLGNLDGMAQLLQNAWRVVTEGQSAWPFDFWRSSRLMPPDPPGFEITEFPFWSFLFADLHPHVMAIPFTILVLGLALTVVFRGQWRRWSTVPLVAAVALVLGSLWPLNTWDYPTYAGIVVAAFTLGVLASERWGARPLGVGLALGGGVVALSYLLFLPFHLRYEGFNNGLVVSETQTALWQYLGIHGLFVFITFSYLLKEGLPRLFSALRSLVTAVPISRKQGAKESLSAILPMEEVQGSEVFASEGSPSPLQIPSLETSRSLPPPGVSRERWIVLFTSAGVLAIALGLAVKGYPVVALLLVALGFTAYLFWRGLVSRRVDSPSTLFVLLLLGVALAIGAGVDLVTVKGDLGRMNTVFKFYEQAWVLLGIASAYLLWRLRFGLALSPALKRVPRGTWMTLFGLLLVSTFIFPVLGTRARLQDRFQVLPLTVDGTAYMREAVYYDPQGGVLQLAKDQGAFLWLQENVQGSPVVMEGITPLYRWGNRVSVYTGLPAVIGWDWHQTQQRGVYSREVTQRRAEVDLFYTTTDHQQALELLRKYQVHYVVVGELERLYYPSEGLAKFTTMEGDSLERVYPANGEDSDVTIYQVKG